ncbi:hypothetical protein HDU93_005520 [Gonapodya sp. JEL0774]|nr:hypothetical protein HDU93_005520 [Gonapodya sp. JEL0774]
MLGTAAQTPPAVPIYIFIDNSNLFIEGKYAVGEHLLVGYRNNTRSNDPTSLKLQFKNLRIDHGMLIDTIAGTRQVQKVFVVGSRPPANDTLWEKIRTSREEGLIHVEVFDRNVAGKEKRVDTYLTTQMVALGYQAKYDNNFPHCIFAVVAGDADYVPPITQVKNISSSFKWETWFWKHSTQKSLKEISYFVGLDDHYRRFCHAVGPPPNRAGPGKIWRIDVYPKNSSPDTLQQEGRVIRLVSEMCRALEVLPWWEGQLHASRAEDTLRFHFMEKKKMTAVARIMGEHDWLSEVLNVYEMAV